MKKSRLLSILCVYVSALGLATSVDAALHGRLPATPGGTDWQAVYDDDRNITWVADATLAASNTFGLAYNTDLGDHPNDSWGSNYKETISTDGFYPGEMTWGAALHWIDAMNAANYLGFNDWRLPYTLQPDDPSCIEEFPVPYLAIGFECTGSELGHLFYEELGAVAENSILTSGDPDLALFSNLGNSYWSDEVLYLDLPKGTAYNFRSGYGQQGTDMKDWPFNITVFAVRDGDVGPPVTIQDTFPWELFMPAIQYGSRSTTEPGIPNILGTYVGTGTATNTNCTDQDINRTFDGSVTVEIFSQEGSKFSGSFAVEIVFEGIIFTGSDDLDGSVTAEGVISGTMDGSFEETASTGTFTGQVSDNTLSFDYLSQDYAGETCTTRGSITAIR